MALKTVVNVDFDSIESDLVDGKRVTTKDLAKAFMVSPVTMRDALVKHFGDRVKFSRGRKGGIQLVGATGWTEVETSVEDVVEL